MVGLYLPGVSVILSIILIILYFSKKRAIIVENKFYVFMLIAELIDSLCVFGLQLEFYLGKEHNFLMIEIINKFDFLMILLWISSFFIYILIVSFGNDRVFRNDNKSLIIPVNILNAVAYLIIIIMRMDIIIKDNSMATVGGISIYLATLFCLIYVILLIFITLTNYKKYTTKYIPVFVMIFILVIIIINFTLNPFFIDISFGITLVNLIMYFTIENPDLKILEEYNRNKELVESSIEDKANMLFKITEEVRLPIRKINKLSNNIIRINNIKLAHDYARVISSTSSNLDNMVNEVLNVADIDRQKVKIIDSKYDIYNLFSQIVYIVKNELDNKIDFKYSISNVIPEKIHGDATKLKQIICSIIFNTASKMKKGVIDLDISSIIKYDMVRLIITISDDGQGLKLQEINNILEYNGKVKQEDLDNADGLKMNLWLTKKIIEYMGGILLIKSEKNVNTTYTIVLDQFINESEVTNNSSFNALISNKKEILLVDDNYKELMKISNELKKKNYKVITTLYAKDCINRLNNNEKFDMVLIDDEMKDFNAVDIMNKLDISKARNLKIIVMLNKDKEIIKDKYLNDYLFSDYLLKDNLTMEIDRLNDKYQ